MKLIFACDTKFGFAKDGRIPWNVPGDIAFFKETTTGHPIVMGRRTWDSLSRKPLPNRTNIVISGDVCFEPPGAVKVAALPTGDFFLIGGSELLMAGAHSKDCEGVYLTTVLGNYNCNHNVQELVEYIRESGNFVWNRVVRVGDNFIVDYFRRNTL